MSSQISWNAMNQFEQNALRRATQVPYIFACRLDEQSVFGANDFAPYICIRLQGWGLLEEDGWSDSSRTGYTITEFGRDVYEQSADVSVTDVSSIPAAENRPTTITASEWHTLADAVARGECEVVWRNTCRYVLTINDGLIADTFDWLTRKRQPVGLDNNSVLDVRWLTAAPASPPAPEDGAGGELPLTIDELLSESRLDALASSFTMGSKTSRRILMQAFIDEATLGLERQLAAAQAEVARLRGEKVSLMGSVDSIMNRAPASEPQAGDYDASFSYGYALAQWHIRGILNVTKSIVSTSSYPLPVDPDVAALLAALERIDDLAYEAQGDYGNVDETYAPIWTAPYKSIREEAAAAPAKVKGEE